MKHSRCSKGFTLAELLVVVTIIGVLTAIAIPVFSAQLEKARLATDDANIRAAYAYLQSANTTGEIEADGKLQVPEYIGISGISRKQLVTFYLGKDGTLHEKPSTGKLDEPYILKTSHPADDPCAVPSGPNSRFHHLKGKPVLVIYNVKDKMYYMSVG